ncbi:MAG: recombinase family protein [Anaerolineales bacterium]|nr:recombinase family protein [Anaerolineales bacterium]
MSTQFIESKPKLEQFTVIKRAIIYARVSTDDQAETGTSIDSQVEKSVAYAAAHNMVIAGIFKEDYTGTTLDRPELNKVRAMLRSGQADVLIAYKTNRLDRSEWGVNLLALLQELKGLGVELHYSQSGRQINLSNPVEALMQSIEGWQAGEDRNEIVRRLTDGKQHRMKQGSVMVFSRPPYGYKVVKEDRLFKLEIEPDEAEVIRMIFQWYTVGINGIPLSLGSIQKKLNEMGVPTASKTGERLVALRQDSNKWYRSVINSMLQNETYVGTWRYGKRNKSRELIAVSVPAIIDQKRLRLPKNAPPITGKKGPKSYPRIPDEQTYYMRIVQA